MKRTYHAQRPTTMTTKKTPYADLLNIKVIFVENGTAHVQTTVRTEHTNHVGTAHGGFINSLADYALELASNSHDVLAVALTTSTQLLQASGRRHNSRSSSPRDSLGKKNRNVSH